MHFKNEFKKIYKDEKSNKIIAKRPIFFLDRDGVIIEDQHYINDPKKVKLCIGAKEFIRNIFNKNFTIVIITNQSGISKGLISFEEYLAVTNSMLKKLESPNPISAIYGNSHISEFPKSNWRKPNPNMILKACEDLNFDLNNSFLIGDRKSDIIAGLRAGVPNLIHIETGHGKEEKKNLKKIFNKECDILNKGSKPNLFFIKNLKNFPYHIINSRKI